MPPYDVVWLIEEGVPAWRIEQHAFVSRVRYEDNGVQYDCYVLNEDIEIWEEHTIDYECD